MNKKKSILFVGHCYYNHWFLSRELRKLGWRADVINIDHDPHQQMYYHGSDYTASAPSLLGTVANLVFFIRALFRYKIFHFGNAEAMVFPPFNQIRGFYAIFGRYAEVRFLKAIGKKIFYTNNGCRDGVTQSSFNKWGLHPICDICPWKNRHDVCSDEKNSQWGYLRNKYTDYIGLLGSNRVDFNKVDHAHEAPWIYCLDKKFWDPDLLIPANYLLALPSSTIKVYHSVGNYDSRNHGEKKRTIKSTELWLEIISQLKAEGLAVEMIFFKDVPNKQLRYYQAQADIVVDMLTFGFFGANVREAMMLGKPAICYLRPSWLSDMARELPEYVRELPVVSATPETAYEKLRELVLDAEMRRDIGRKMRKFGLRWHASDVAAETADKIYHSFLS